MKINFRLSNLTLKMPNIYPSINMATPHVKKKKKNSSVFKNFLRYSKLKEKFVLI